MEETITKSTIHYKLELLDSIRGWQSPGVAPHPGTWPGFNADKLEDLTEDMLAAWLIKHRKNYSARRTNGAVTVLREIGDLAVRKKCLPAETWDSAKKGLTFVKVAHVQRTLPEPSQVEALRQEIYTRCQKRGTLGAWLFDFLLLRGARIDSATHVLWEDVKWSVGQVFFRKAKRGTCFVPLFPQLKDLLGKLRAQHRTRLKILGHARVEDARQHPELVAKLAAAEARPIVERLFFVDVVAFDWNCPKYITPRYIAAEVEAVIAPLRQRIAELEAQLKTKH